MKTCSHTCSFARMTFAERSVCITCGEPDSRLMCCGFYSSALYFALWAENISNRLHGWNGFHFKPECFYFFPLKSFTGTDLFLFPLINVYLYILNKFYFAIPIQKKTQYASDLFLIFIALRHNGTLRQMMYNVAHPLRCMNSFLWFLITRKKKP